MSLNALVMTVLLVAALAVFIALILPRFRLLLAAGPEPRFDHLGARLGGTLKLALGQWRMPRDPVAGTAHIFIFSGFVIVAFATVSHFVHAYAPEFALPGKLGELYSLVKDLCEFLVILGVTYGLWRRLEPTPSRVGRSGEGVFVLCLIMVLMLSDFLISGSELVAAGELVTGLPYNPGGYVGRLALAPLGAGTAHVVGVAAWWLHCVVILVFLNFLPLGKHFHVITAFPNVFFRNLNPWGQGKKEADLIAAMENDDLETIEHLGIGTTAELSWSMILNNYSCTECGRCAVYCPTVLTHKPLEHRKLNLALRDAVYADEAALLSGDKEKLEGLEPLVGGKISADTVWACTTCGSCEQECPLFIENVPRIIEMRKKLGILEEVPAELQRAFKGLEQNQNPWGIGSDKRDEWAEGLDIPRMADVAKDGEAPLLYWVGCAGSFDDRIKKITVAMVEILRAAKVEFAILGKEETCTGDTARRAGNEFLFQMMAQSNVELLNGYHVKRIVTHCPHCLHTLGTEYPQFGGNYEVVHHTQLIAELLRDGKLQLTKGAPRRITWHDSCYLGRYHNTYDAPRDLVRALPGATLVEMPRNQSRAVCCGAGGARFWMEEDIGERINVHRATEALATEPDCVGSSCPFCLTMLKDGVADLGKTDTVKTEDIAEMIAAAL